MSSHLIVLGLGFAHFMLGAFWYSPLGFANAWMRGLGLTQADISEARVNIPAALAASAVASFAQAATIVWLLIMIGRVDAWRGGLVGAAVAVAFSFLPMLKDRVWANRGWSVILVDAGYEIVAAVLVGGAAAWLLG